MNFFSPGFTLNRFLTLPPPFHHPTVRTSLSGTSTFAFVFDREQRPFTEKTDYWRVQLEPCKLVENVKGVTAGQMELVDL